MSEFIKKKLFNPEGDDRLSHRRIINGNSTNLFNLNNVKYQWANRLYRAMMDNFWIPQKVALVNDKTDYAKLTPAEQKAYNGILSFLVFLDSLQTNNLPNVGDFITAPEVNLALSVQTYQEAIHSESYAYILESIIPNEQGRQAIYEFWRKDEVLFKRIQYIAQMYQDFLNSPSDELFAKVLIADWLLEGIYFYNGFNFFYNLASKNLMIGTKDIIKYINRDELTHVVLFQNIIQSVREENPTLISDELIYQMMKDAVEFEIDWAKHIIGEEILGMSPKSIESHTHWLANGRLKSLGLKPIYQEVKENPFRHLGKIADVESAGDSKGNFFEAKVTSYNQSSIFDDWEDV